MTLILSTWDRHPAPSAVTETLAAVALAATLWYGLLVVHNYTGRDKP